MLLLLLAFVSITRNKIIYERENALKLLAAFEWQTCLLLAWYHRGVKIPAAVCVVQCEGAVFYYFFPFIIFIKCCRREVYVWIPCTVLEFADTLLLVPCRLFGKLLTRSRVNIRPCVCLRCVMLPLGIINSSSGFSFHFVMKWNNNGFER